MEESWNTDIDIRVCFLSGCYKLWCVLIRFVTSKGYIHYTPVFCVFMLVWMGFVFILKHLDGVVDEALVKHLPTCWVELSKVSTAERQGRVKGQTAEVKLDSKWVICLLITDFLYQLKLIFSLSMSFIPTFNQSNTRQTRNKPFCLDG